MQLQIRAGRTPWDRWVPGESIVLRYYIDNLAELHLQKRASCFLLEQDTSLWLISSDHSDSEGVVKAIWSYEGPTAKVNVRLYRECSANIAATFWQANIGVTGTEKLKEFLGGGAIVDHLLRPRRIPAAHVQQSGINLFYGRLK